MQQLQAKKIPAHVIYENKTEVKRMDPPSDAPIAITVTQTAILARDNGDIIVTIHMHPDQTYVNYGILSVVRETLLEYFKTHFYSQMEIALQPIRRLGEEELAVPDKVFEYYCPVCQRVWDLANVPNGMVCDVHGFIPLRKRWRKAS